MSRMDGERRGRPGKGDAPDEVQGNSCCAQMNTPGKGGDWGQEGCRDSFYRIHRLYLPNVSPSVGLIRFPLNLLQFHVSPALSIRSC